MVLASGVPFANEAPTVRLHIGEGVGWGRGLDYPG